MPTHRDGAALGIPAAALILGHTLVLAQHIARLAGAALCTGGRGSDALTAAIRVKAGGRAGGKAVGVGAVGRACQSYGVEEEGAQWRCLRAVGTGLQRNGHRMGDFYSFSFIYFHSTGPEGRKN